MDDLNCSNWWVWLPSSLNYRINDGMFCFAHLQSCHNGWAFIRRLNFYFVSWAPKWPNQQSKIGFHSHPLQIELDVNNTDQIEIVNPFPGNIDRQSILFSIVQFFIVRSIDGIKIDISLRCSTRSSTPEIFIFIFYVHLWGKDYRNV